MTMTPREKVELKPCPFCGGSDIRFDCHRGAGRHEHRGDDVWSMCCYDCGATFPNMYRKDGLVEAWNRRTALASGSGDHAELAAIISDEEIVRVHGYANFGEGITPREVVNDGVRKYAVGYHSGHTQLCILMEHGLITKPRPGGYDANLTKKGKKYARALYRSQSALLAENAALRAERRNIVSHATMGDTDGGDLSVNEISVRITAIRNEMHTRATEAERKLAEAVGLLRDSLAPGSFEGETEINTRIRNFLRKEAERGCS